MSLPHCLGAAVRHNLRCLRVRIGTAVKHNLRCLGVGHGSPGTFGLAPDVWGWALGVGDSRGAGTGTWLHGTPIPPAPHNETRGANDPPTRRGGVLTACGIARALRGVGESRSQNEIADWPNFVGRRPQIRGDPPTGRTGRGRRVLTWRWIQSYGGLLPTHFDQSAMFSG
jgi:hypothetical protein